MMQKLEMPEKHSENSIIGMLNDLKEMVTGMSDKMQTINGNIGTLKTNRMEIRKLNT